MSTFWHCDLCDKKTSINPPTEMVTEEKDVEYEIPDIDPNKPEGPHAVKKVTIRQKVPKVSKMKRQNHITGEIEDIDIPMTNDLFPRAYIMQLNIGPESVIKDFCLDCLKREILPIAQPLWDKLASIKGSLEG